MLELARREEWALAEERAAARRRQRREEARVAAGCEASISSPPLLLSLLPTSFDTFDPFDPSFRMAARLVPLPVLLVLVLPDISITASR